MSFICTSVIPLPAQDFISSPGPTLLEWYHVFLSPTRAWRMITWSSPEIGTIVFIAQFYVFLALTMLQTAVNYCYSFDKS